MPKLNQINAIVSGRKSDTEKAVTELYKLIQKDTLFTGRERTYRPMDEVNGQKQPSESQRVQQRADDLIRQAVSKWIDLWNLIYTQDLGNQQAKADVAQSETVFFSSTLPMREMALVLKSRASTSVVLPAP